MPPFNDPRALNQQPSGVVGGVLDRFINPGARNQVANLGNTQAPGQPGTIGLGASGRPQMTPDPSQADFRKAAILKRLGVSSVSPITGGPGDPIGRTNVNAALEQTPAPATTPLRDIATNVAVSQFLLPLLSDQLGLNQGQGGAVTTPSRSSRTVSV